MEVSALVWGITILVIIGLFVFDFFSHVRVPHEPTLRESGFWSAVYISLAVIFGLFVWWKWGSTYGGEYFAGYVTEKALSVDNLFVFVIIMSKFMVPRIYQQKVLLLGIVMALILRALFIAAGAAAIAAYSWVFYLFGLFLILTAIKLLTESDEPVEHEREREGRIERFAKRFLRTTDTYDGDKFFTRENGKRMATPLLMVLVVIGFTDVLFALDSIPAIYGLTQEPYLVFAANAFALMGLRQLYFLIGGLLNKLIYLSFGLSFILAFIGVKLVFHALHENELPFINGGEHVPVPEISTPLSLGVIGGTLVITTVASLVVSSRRARKDSPTP
ncbi:tellurium resistance protein TerC [Gordonia iterans]|uniref:Tellurium resistance protein TerC n=1 Tax=Gordonia iterans TaxID=1004901 RepID=A0A2S0KFJ5_9ACTN|nr:TerC family protein [Gordonia iterans]AVM00468.1 tellurium resistance protein TerC [Gordonia iterans]